MAQTAAANQTATAGVEQALASALTELAPTTTTTNTPTPTFTPTLTPTATATPNPLAEVVVAVGSIWSGPGAPYQIILNANQGDQFEAVGWSIDGQWLIVLLQNEEPGWIKADQIQISERAANLPPITPPPRPTPLRSFTLTVETDRGDIQLTIHSTGKTYHLREYWVHTIEVEGGWQTFSYSWSLDEGANCAATIFIDHDIFWQPPPSAIQFCASLPGGKNT